MRNDFARKIHGAEKIQIERALPVVEARGEEAFGGRASSVGHTNIDSAEPSRHGRDEPADRGRIAYIARFSQHFHSVLLPDLLCRRLPRLIIARSHGDAAAFGREGCGSVEADSLTGRVNQVHTIFKSQVHGNSSSRYYKWSPAKD